MNLSSTFTLNNGVEIPVVGFGTWQLPNDESTTEIVKHAIAEGYRHIDTAKTYGNEEAVGQAVAQTDVPREDLFVTTKLWNDVLTYDEAHEAIDQSLERLGLDYVDLLLIHWPNPIDVRNDGWQERNKEVWRAMEEALEAGKVKAIGISNFMKRHMDELLKTAKVKPAVNQLYLNPSDQQKELTDYCKDQGILLEAYSPLGSGSIFEIEELQDLADKYDKTPAQVVLRWQLHKDFLPLPKTATMERVGENADIFDFDLAEEDIKTLDGFAGQAGSQANPDEKKF